MLSGTPLGKSSIVLMMSSLMRDIVLSKIRFASTSLSRIEVILSRFSTSSSPMLRYPIAPNVNHKTSAVQNHFRKNINQLLVSSK